jgi:ribosomal protein S18 acetylase RimI-like enzyme
VGTALLEAGVYRLPDDVSAVRLETLSRNERAAAFYEARGFARTEIRSVDVGGDSYPAYIYTPRLDCACGWSTPAPGYLPSSA